MNKFVILALALLACTTFAYDCSGLLYYTGERGYNTGDTVVFGGKVYQSVVNENWCQQLADTNYWKNLGDCDANHCSGVPDWNQDAHYPAGTHVILDGVVYQATEYNYCQNPCQPGTPWKPVYSCYIDCSNAPVFDKDHVYLKNDIVQFDGFLYISFFWNQNSNPKDNSGNWQAWKKIVSCQFCVTVDKGDCLSINTDAHFCLDPGSVVSVTATPNAGECRVIGGATQTFTLTSSVTITFDCECKVTVTTTGDCVISPSGPLKFWPSDKDDVTINVSAPVPDPGYSCVIDYVKLDGVAAGNSVTLTDIVVDHEISTDCHCFQVACAHTGCDNTAVWDNTKHYQKCDCAKYTVADWDNSPSATFVFCTNAYSYCQSPENYDNWELEAICSPAAVTCANVANFAGKEYERGTIIKYGNKLYFAKWTTALVPGSEDPKWGSWKYLKDC